MKYAFAKSNFDSAAANYDLLRRKYIPCFDEFYRTAIELIPFPPESPIHILDLGAGTGLLSEFAATAFPNAHITLADFSEAMLEKARARFANHPSHIEFIQSDYANAPIPPGFDAIISALSIHHLTDPDKRTLFQRIFHALNPGGIFINADNIRAADPAIQEQNRSIWIKRMKELGVTDTELHEALERTKADKLGTLEEQLDWLHDIGFARVDCPYKWRHFVVFNGRRGL